MQNTTINKVGAAMRPPFFIFGLIILLFFSACTEQATDSSKVVSYEAQESLFLESSESEKIEILRDQYGTPHIYASSNFGVYYGYGYALATDRLFQMEMLKRTVEGRVAEVMGEKYLALDKMIRSSYDHRAVSQQLKKMSAEDRDVLDGYARGFTHRINEVLSDQKLLPKEFKDFDFMPEVWTAYDSAMIFVGAIAHRYSDFNSELDNLKLLESLTKQHGQKTAWKIFNSSKWLTDPGSPTTVPRTGQGKTSRPVAQPNYLKVAAIAPPTKRVVLNDDGGFFGTSDQPGALAKQIENFSSNGFVGPEFSAASNFWSVNKNLTDARGVLVNGPQFGWGLPSYVYGVGLHGGDFNVVGNTLLGLPGLLFAHNNYVGWGSTAGLSDQVDVYIEKLDPSNSEAYIHNGESKAFDVWNETIKVRNADDVHVTARRTVHGMVVQMNVDNGFAYARARAWEGGELDTLMAWINLAKDRTLDQVQERISKVTSNINFYYMDVAGNIGFIHGGRYPQRTKEHDSRLPAPGTGELDWVGFTPYKDNPTVRNPEQGYIVNWNNRPAENWPSIDLWSYTWNRADRSSHIFEELKAGADLSIEEAWEVNNRVSFDDVSGVFLLPFLQQAWEGEAASDQVELALQALLDWDAEWRADDNAQFGAEELLLETWSNVLFEKVLKDDVGADNFALYSATQNPNSPLGPSLNTSVGAKVIIRNLDFLTTGATPEYDFFNGVDYRSVLRETFQATVISLYEKHGSDLARWKLAAAPMQWKPYNFRGVPQALESAGVELPAYLNRGSENNIFSVDGENFSARDVIPPGQSGFIGIDGTQSPHYSDQLKLFADFETKVVPFDRKGVDEITISREVISVQKKQDLVPSAKLAGAASSVSLIKSALQKAENAKHLGAFIYLDAEGALAAARKADEVRESGGSLGQLHGVPIVVKDNIHVANMPNSAGTLALKSFIPDSSNAVVAALQNAGAIVLGKTNMHELAFGITSNNAAFGPVRNAHKDTHIAGGSSGGTAVAIASGIATMGLGTDTGGSTRIPAALNGIAGFRPSLGRYNSQDVTPVASTRDTVGPMAATVKDIAILDAVVVGAESVAQAASLDGLRLGISRDYFYQNLAPEVNQNIDQVLAKLSAAGVEIVEVELSGLVEANNGVSFPVVMFEIVKEMAKYLSNNNTGVTVQELLDGIESPDVKGALQGAFDEQAISEEVYRQAIDVFRPELQAMYKNAFTNNDIEAFIAPTTILPAVTIDGSDEMLELNDKQESTFLTYIRNADPSSNAGLPSLSVPSGETDDGLPMGIMLDGPVNSDRRLLEIGLAIEKLL